LAKGISEILLLDKLKKMNTNGRKLALELLYPKTQIDILQKLFIQERDDY